MEAFEDDNTQSEPTGMTMKGKGESTKNIFGDIVFKKPQTTKTWAQVTKSSISSPAKPNQEKPNTKEPRNVNAM